MRDRERRLSRAAQDVEELLQGAEPAPWPAELWEPPLRHDRHRSEPQISAAAFRLPLLAAIALAAAAFPLGLLIGWLIWG